MDEKDKTLDDLKVELWQTLDQHPNGRELAAPLRQYVDKLIEERVYTGKAHAELGRHVEAIMKHFLGLK